jgi:AraC-like DNA-binding protein
MPAGNSFYLILFGISGNGSINTRNRNYPLKSDTVLIIPPGTTYEYTAESLTTEELWKYYWIHPFGDISTRLTDYFTSKAKREGAVYSLNMPVPEYTDIIRMLLEKSQQDGFEGAAGEVELTYETSRLLYLLGKKMLAGAEQWQSISHKIIGYFEKNYGKKITLDQLENLCFVNKSHMIKTFKKETGFTPYEYLNRMRTERAWMLMLHSGANVSMAAEMCGFHKSSSFISYYRRLYGTTPGKNLKFFRKQGRDKSL